MYNPNQILINNQLDYYKQRLIEQHLLEHSIILDYTLSVSIGNIRKLGSTQTNNIQLASNLVTKLQQYPLEFPNPRIIVEHTTIKRINKKLNTITLNPITYYTVYFGRQLSKQQLNNMSSFELGTLYGYNQQILTLPYHE